MQVKRQQLELDIKQQTGSKLEKEYVKAVYCHLAYLTYMQNTSWEVKYVWNYFSQNKELGNCFTSTLTLIIKRSF